jgi:hypothetical protein
MDQNPSGKSKTVAPELVPHPNEDEAFNSIVAAELLEWVKLMKTERSIKSCEDSD